VDAEGVEEFPMDEFAAVDRFRALGDPVRWSIVRRLSVSTTSARLLAEAVHISPTLLSHHRKVLREAGLITGTRRGRWIDYALEPKALIALGEVLQAMAAEQTPAQPRHSDLVP
jgi:ArsR family transcriptional regulator